MCTKYYSFIVVIGNGDSKGSEDSEAGGDNVGSGGSEGSADSADSVGSVVYLGNEDEDTMGDDEKKQQR